MPSASRRDGSRSAGGTGRGVRQRPSVVSSVADREVRTVESLGTMERMHPVQQAFVDAGAVQCGFCTPGFVISTVALLRANPEPSDAEIKEALAGNICRCTGYGKILEAVHRAAGQRV